MVGICPYVCYLCVYIRMTLFLLFSLLVFPERLQFICFQLLFQWNLERINEPTRRICQSLFFRVAVEFKIENRDSTGKYLLRRVPPALGDARILLHGLVSDQLLALTLQLLNLTEKCTISIIYQFTGENLDSRLVLVTTTTIT